jgi:hypothetical protein
MVQVPSGGFQSSCTYGSESFKVVLFGKTCFIKQKGQQNCKLLLFKGVSCNTNISERAQNTLSLKSPPNLTCPFFTTSTSVILSLPLPLFIP